MIAYIAAVVCVLGLAAGQLLFKLSAQMLTAPVQPPLVRTLGVLAAAGLLYALMTVLWVWVLTRVELGRVYPIMALSFVVVPLGNHLIFKTELHFHMVLGSGIIALGIVLSTWGPR